MVINDIANKLVILSTMQISTRALMKIEASF